MFCIYSKSISIYANCFSNNVLYSLNALIKIFDGNQDGIFTPGYYEVPLGETLKFVVVSMINDNWSYHVSTLQTVTGPTTSYIVPTLTPAADEEAMGTALLNEL